MANLTIENNLGESSIFSFRKRNNRWMTIKGGEPAESRLIQDNEQYLFFIEGTPINNNTIILELENSPYFIEIIDEVIMTGPGPEDYSHSAIIRFTPTNLVFTNPLVKSHNSPIAPVNNNLNSEVWVRSGFTETRQISGKKNVANPILKNISNTGGFTKEYDFNNCDTFEFRVILNDDESCKYTITIMNNNIAVPYTLTVFDNGKNEVRIKRNPPLPSNINITIEPD